MATVPATTDKPTNLPVAAKVIDLPTAVDDAERDQALADKIADGLTALADFVRANPHLAVHMKYTGLTHHVGISVSIADDPRDAVAAFARALNRAGYPVTKKPFGTGDSLFGISADIGETGFGLDVWADRNEVCERVVTGTETVVKEVPDPELLAAVPTVKVVETVETVEWHCGSLLAPAGSVTAS